MINDMIWVSDYVLLLLRQKVDNPEISQKQRIICVGLQSQFCVPYSPASQGQRSQDLVAYSTEAFHSTKLKALYADDYRAPFRMNKAFPSDFGTVSQSSLKSASIFLLSKEPRAACNVGLISCTLVGNS